LEPPPYVVFTEPEERALVGWVGVGGVGVHPNKSGRLRGQARDCPDDTPIQVKVEIHTRTHRGRVRATDIRTGEWIVREHVGVRDTFEPTHRSGTGGFPHQT
jgi:hypothetical protein